MSSTHADHANYLVVLKQGGPLLGLFSAADAEAAYDMYLKDLGYRSREAALGAHEDYDPEGAGDETEEEWTARKVEEQRDMVRVEETPYHDVEDLDWVLAHKAEAFADLDGYPEGIAVLWRREDYRFFAHPNEDHSASASKVALVNLEDGSVVD